MPNHPIPSTGLRLGVSPPGFEVHFTPRRALLGVPCADCEARLATVATFTGGPGICTVCDGQRSLLADLFAAFVRGATPEELVAEDLAAPAYPDAASRELERREMRDHADILVAVLRGRS